MSATMVEVDLEALLAQPPTPCTRDDCDVPAEWVAILPCDCQQPACTPHYEWWWARAWRAYEMRTQLKSTVEVHHPPIGCGRAVPPAPPRGRKL